jgi:hypothetical protein
MKVGTLTLLAAFAASACQDSEGPVAADPVAEGTAPGPVATAAACPCWDEAQLATAFPAAHFYRDADGVASLNRFDHDNAQQIQALVSIASAGAGSCELASFGTSGQIEALASAEALTATQCAACGSLLAGLAVSAGLVTEPATDKPIE